MLLQRPARTSERAFVATPTEIVDIRVEKGIAYADPKDPVAVDALLRHHGFTPAAAAPKKARATKPAAKKSAAKKSAQKVSDR